MLLKVLHKVHDRSRQVGEQHRVVRHLVGVRIVTAVLHVEDARPQARRVHPRHVAQVPRDGVPRVLDVGLVHRRRRLELVRARQHVHARLRQVFHDGTRPDGRAVHALEDVQRLFSLALLGYARQQPVAVQVPHGGHRHARHRHGPRQAPAEVDPCQHVLLLRVKLADSTANPAFRPQGDRLARVHDVHGAEVRPARVRVSDALHDAHLTLVVQVLERRRRGVERQRVVDRQRLLLLDPHQRPGVVVVPIGVGHHGVHEVVAA